jgi:eukaryotic-like serine/threonine-protein kinase
MTSLPDPDRWTTIAPILAEALELAPDQRKALLDRACAGDAALRREIEELLSADERAGAFLGAPVDLAAFVVPGDEAPAGATPAADTTIGPYRVLREIGRGGMGVVYEAEQRNPRRSVALKVVLGGRHVDADAVRMFRRETDTLARLKHPSIAAIYESGSTDEGQHYFAMELVQGSTLSDRLDAEGPARTRADVRLRLLLFRKICAAVAYAHQRGVIHLDLKPSNILVLDAAARGDGHGEAGVPDIKVLDFGLARITDPDAQATAVTAFGRVQGTLPYMSPEQVRGRRDEIDVRSDVYSLGVILYRMLTGRLPYDLEGAGITEAARIVCEVPPRPLSAPAAAMRFDHDLAVLVLKALEKDPGRRYSGVSGLEEDVGRYLDGRPILARAPSTLYQIRKMVVRHKAPFGAAAALLVLLVAFAVSMTFQARRIAAERDRASREAMTARRVSDFLTDLFKVSDPDETRGNTVKAREILDTGVDKIGKELVDEPEVQARLMQSMGKVYANLGLYRKATPILEQSVATRRRLLGEEHPDTLATMQDLAVLYVNSGRRPEAEKLYDRVLEIRRRLLGDEHPDTLYVMSGLAFLYRIQGRFEESEKLSRQVLEARRRVLGKEHIDTLQSEVDLAGLYYAERRYPESEALYRPAIETLQRVLGEDNSVTLRNVSALANVYEREGRFAEAEALHRDSRDRLRRLLGDDHLLTLNATNSLAVLLDDEGRYTDAETLYRDNLARERRVLGDDHPNTLTSMNNLANVLSSQRRYPEAEALFRESLERARRILGEDHPDTTNTLYNLACMSVLRGDRAAALDWLGQAVAHGYSHWDVMAKDSDLKPLRDSPAFEALVARSKKNADREAAARSQATSTAGTSPVSSASRADIFR